MTEDLARRSPLATAWRHLDRELDRFGLGQAVHGGIGVAAAWRPSTGVAVVPADLPCLRAAEVTQVVTEVVTAGSDPAGAFVPTGRGRARPS